MHSHTRVHLVIQHESNLLLSSRIKKNFLCLDSYGMTNGVDRLGEWLILCLEKVRLLCTHIYAPTLSLRRNLDHFI